MRLYVEAVFGSILLQAASRRSAQAKDTLAGTVGLLYKQSGLKDTINGFTRMGALLAGL